MCIQTGYSARVEADSVSPDGIRLTTFVVSYPRIVHSEMLTHRVFSRNSSSSRAIPVTKMIEAVEQNPFIPEYWGKEQKGMQAQIELSETSARQARKDWEYAALNAVNSAKNLLYNGVHKQICNRLLEPFSWITVIITATEWKNFFTLRCSSDAQPEMKKIADMMKKEYDRSKPRAVNYKEWHLPFVQKSEEIFSQDTRIRISVARCARVSYLNHEGQPYNIERDLALCDRLISSKHLSPTEHQAYAYPSTYNALTASSNLEGWIQYRKTIPNESGS